MKVTKKSKYWPKFYLPIQRTQASTIEWVVGPDKLQAHLPLDTLL